MYTNIFQFVYIDTDMLYLCICIYCINICIYVAYNTFHIYNISYCIYIYIYTAFLYIIINLLYYRYSIYVTNIHINTLSHIYIYIDVLHIIYVSNVKIGQNW